MMHSSFTRKFKFIPLIRHKGNPVQEVRIQQTKDYEVYTVQEKGSFVRKFQPSTKTILLSPQDTSSHRNPIKLDPVYNIPTASNPNLHNADACSPHYFQETPPGIKSKKQRTMRGQEAHQNMVNAQRGQSSSIKPILLHLKSRYLLSTIMHPIKNKKRKGKGKKTWEGEMKRRWKWVATLRIKPLQNWYRASQSDLCPLNALNRAVAIASSSQSSTSLLMNSLTA